MKNILITGINGFVGTAAAKYFNKKGYHVVGLVRDLNIKTQSDIHNFCSIVRGDICDKELVRSILAKYEIDYVLHLAAMPIVRICNNDPYSAYMTNVMGTVNLLESCRVLEKGPEKIIVMTSDKAYGPHENLPYTEESHLEVADSYCTSKACQDMVARSYAMTYDLPVITVRAGNIYGPGDLNVSRLIPNSTLKLINGESPMLYSGVSEFVREFIYIDNILDAYDVLLEHGVTKEAYNIGGTVPHKILDVITLIRDKVDKSIEIDIVERTFYEIEAQYLDASKLTALGWESKVSLSEGLDRTIEWLKNFNLMRKLEK